MKQHLASVGGLKRDDLFMGDLRGLTAAENWPKFSDRKLKFVFSINNEPKFSETNDNLYDFLVFG